MPLPSAINLSICGLCIFCALQRVEKRANGFRKKLMRQDAYGLDANVKKKLAEKKKKAQAMMSQEEADEKLKVAMERKAEVSLVPLL